MNQFEDLDENERKKAMFITSLQLQILMLRGARDGWFVLACLEALILGWFVWDRF